jgi:hypothetical protein
MTHLTKRNRILMIGTFLIIPFMSGALGSTSLVAISQEGNISPASQVGKNMTQEEKNIVMNEFSKQNSTVDENMSETAMPLETKPITGTFMGAGDGIHNAEGVAKVISLQDGNKVLRLENLKATNGPDLYVYLATDKTASDFVDAGKLKGNIGNQNYNIPQGTDLSKYNTVLIWCKQFSVLFGSAKLANV